MNGSAAPALLLDPFADDDEDELRNIAKKFEEKYVSCSIISELLVNANISVNNDNQLLFYNDVIVLELWKKRYYQLNSCSYYFIGNWHHFMYLLFIGCVQCGHFTPWANSNCKGRFAFWLQVLIIRFVFMNKHPRVLLHVSTAFIETDHHF